MRPVFRALIPVARTYRNAFAGLPRDVWLLSGAALVNRAGTMVLPFLTLYLTSERGFTAGQAGLVMMVYGLGSAAGSYLGGWLSDRVGSVRTQVLSLAGTGVGFLWLTRLGGLAEIALALFLTSVVSEAFRPAVMTATAERSPEHLQARSFALLRQAVNLGMAVGPTVGGFLALYGYAWIFIGDAVTCWISAGILLLVLSPHPVRQEDVEVVGSGRPPWKDGPFLGLIALVFLLACAFFQLFTTVPLYLRDAYGLRESGIGLLLGFNAMLILVFEMVLIHWAERFNRLVLIGVGSFLVCLGLGIMPVGAPSVLFAAFTVIVWSLGEMLTLPLTNALVATRAGRAHRGRYMGLYTMSFSLALIVAPAGGGWIYEHVGRDLLWYGIAGLGVPLGLAALLLVPAFRPDPARAAAPDPPEVRDAAPERDGGPL